MDFRRVVRLFVLSDKPKISSDVPFWRPFSKDNSPSSLTLDDLIKKYNSSCESYLKSKKLCEIAIENSMRKIEVFPCCVSEMFSGTKKLRPNDFNDENIIIIDIDTMIGKEANINQFSKLLTLDVHYDLIQVSSKKENKISFFKYFEDSSVFDGGHFYNQVDFLRFLARDYCRINGEILDIISKQLGVDLNKHLEVSQINSLGRFATDIQVYSNLMNLPRDERINLALEAANEGYDVLINKSRRSIPNHFLKYYMNRSKLSTYSKPIAQMSIEDAVKKAISEAPDRRFSESVDLAINLHNIDLTLPGNRVDVEVILPHGLGKPTKIAVFAAGETALRAKSAGADRVISADEIKVFAGDKRAARKLADEYKFFIAETQFMPVIGKSLGSILGKRGKMPTPLPPTQDVTPQVQRLKNMIRIRSRDRPTFHLTVGNRNMNTKELAENIEAVIVKLEQTLKDGRRNMKSVYVKEGKGPKFRII